MTVCIACICDFMGKPAMVVASDRMLTAGDIEFERPTAKQFRLGKGICALIAGDAGAQDEICAHTKARLGNDSFTVEQAADAYCKEVAAYHLRVGEQKVLAPFGLTMEAFISSQKKLGPLADRLLFSLDEVRRSLGIATIIAGVDNSGAHLYSIDSDGGKLCHDSAGFVAIGSGGRQAESQFMFQRYAPNFHIAKALLLVYTAKRRAEVAPGVGKDTDMFMIAPEDIIQVLPEVVGYLKLTCETIEAQIVLAQSEKEAAITRMYQEAIAALQDQPSASGGTPQIPDAQRIADAPAPTPTDQAQTN